MNTLLSVVIPVYKTEPFLTKCLQSVISQSYADFEVIVVDDGSDGNAAEIVGSFHDGRIKYVRHEKNRSLLQARITGVKAASGQYVLSLDSDDSLAPDTLKTIHRRLAADHFRQDVIHYRMLQVSPQTRREDLFPLPEGQYDAEEILRLFLKKKIGWSVCGKVIRTENYRQVLRELEFMPDGYVNSMEDLLQFFPLLFSIKKYEILDFFGYYYFQHEESMSHHMAKSAAAWTSLCNNVGLVRQTVLKLAQQHDLSPDQLFLLEDLFTPTAINVTRHEGSKFSADSRDARLGQWFRIFNPFVVTIPFLQEFLLDAYKMLAQEFRRTDRKPIRKIAVYSPQMRQGGTERVIARMLSLWTAHFPEIRFVLISLEPADENDYDYPRGIPRLVISRDMHLHQWELMQALQKNDVDTILFANILGAYCIQDAIACHIAGYNTIGMEHGSVVYNVVFYSDSFMRKKYYAEFFDTITALSDLNCAFWQACGFRQYVTHRNPLTFSLSDASAERPEKQNIVLFIGRLSPEKAPEKVIRMFAELHKMDPLAKLLIVGSSSSPDEPVPEELTELCSTLGVGNHVEFCGEQKDVARYYQIAKVHVMTSMYEGAPMVLFEAKNFCVPTVMFALPYLDCATEEDGCIQVPQDDFETMAKTVKKLLDDEPYRQRMGTLARQGLSKFSDDVFVAWWKRFLAEFEALDFSQAVPGQLPKNYFEPIFSALPHAISIRSNPEKDPLKIKIEKKRSVQHGKKAKKNSELQQIRNSLSYRIGRAITWPPRMVRSTFRCLRDNGPVYTLHRILAKFTAICKKFCR